MNWDPIAYLQELKEFELLEAYFLARESVTIEITVFMTILFGYLTVAYFLGTKLSRFQGIVVTTLYSFFALYLTFGIYDAQQTLANIVLVMSGEDMAFFVVATPSFLVLCWIVSIVFFMQSRKSGDA